MTYWTIKYLHVSCVMLSISLFVLRGCLQLAGVDWRRWKLLRIAPHVVDTALLGAAIWLTLLLHQYPFANSWLTAKLLALVAYILLGTIALKATQPPARAAAAGVAALFCVSYIVSVATTHSATLGFF
ncbi:SirB2 family protein [Uliginosibacterium flavum]|uniref:SirB2 family protein n=1 Tax=Uliginosibacterium flavum TaxID=1396831 RepID=A0ABV2TQ56_9RHOO